MDCAEPRQAPGSFLMVQLLTFSRVPLAVAFAALLLSLTWSYLTLGACLFVLVLAEFTDLLDGWLARRLGVASEWGSMLDPYADSVSRLIVYWAQAVSGLVIPLVPLVMALRDVSVAYCRIVLMKHGRPVSANWSGKVKAIVQGFGAMFAVLGPLHWQYTGKWTVQAISWIVAAVTAASVVQYARAAVSATREAGADASGASQQRG